MRNGEVPFDPNVQPDYDYPAQPASDVPVVFAPPAPSVPNFGLPVGPQEQRPRQQVAQPQEPPQSPQAPIEPNGFCPQNTQCLPLNQCAFISSNGIGTRCSTSVGRGVCCPNPSVTGSDREIPSVPVIFPDDQPTNPLELLPTSIPFISPADFQRAVTAAQSFMTQIQSTENQLSQRRLFAAPRTAVSDHQNFFGNNPESIRLSRLGQMAVKIATELVRNFKLTRPQSKVAFKALSFANSVTDTCPTPVQCFRSKYRTADGSCNNRRNPDWGKSFTPFNRIVFPEYEDNFDAAKVTGTTSRQPLPSARLVSTTVAPDRGEVNSFVTNMVMQWGQFLDHDMTSTATTRSNDGQSIRCCGQEFQQDPSLLHPACMPIVIPPNDPFFAQFGQDCMSFVRSGVAPREGCALGQREQLNQLSAFIDGGMVYGRSQQETESLRSFSGGKLRNSFVDGKEFLPKRQSTCSIPREKNQQCFDAGDGRINVQVNLVVIHAVFLRYHNLIASELARINPSWDDEALFQETRRIVIATIQHITYNEFLPLVLGKNIMSTFNLKPTADGYSNDYDEKVNPAIVSSFATAAYRMHTLIARTVEFKDSKSGNTVGQLDLSETYNNPSVLYEKDAFPNLINGLISQSSGDFDPSFTDQISNHLFRPFGGSFGVDLVAMNIQRGRDHGLPGYNKWRTSCNLRPVNSFQELQRVMRPGAAEAMQSLYSSVDDVDLFIAGSSEIPLRGSLVGPTFACIMGEQFRRLKDGDRFWYENPNNFNPNQLAEIRNITLARVLCDASAGSDSEGIQFSQKFVMIQPNGDWNMRTDCNDINQIPKADWSAWYNEPV